MSSILLLVCAVPGLAQQPDDELRISLRRDWGFGLGGQIQGRFSLRADGPDDLNEVRYMLDDELMGAATDPPFTLQFHTDDYPPGVHEIYAIGFRASGAEIRSTSMTLQFLSSEEAGGSVTRFIVPLVIVIVAVAVLATVLPALLSKGQGRFKLGEYGIAGGAVCSACKMPFSRHAMSPNLVVGKLSRCPHCGKWGIARRATPSELETAEARYRQDQEQGQAQSEHADDDLRRQLDESRYSE